MNNLIGDPKNLTIFSTDHLANSTYVPPVKEGQKTKAKISRKLMSDLKFQNQKKILAKQFDLVAKIPMPNLV